MIFFFHHYELPAILRRGLHNLGGDQIIEGELELDILNLPADDNVTDNVIEPVQNEMNASNNDNDGNATNGNVVENSNHIDVEESRSNRNSIHINGETLRQRAQLPGDTGMMNNSGPNIVQTPSFDSTLNTSDDSRTS